MYTKFVVAGIAAGLTLFLTGFIFYVLLFADFFTTGVERDPYQFPFIIAGEIVFGFLLAWIISRIVGSANPVAGAKAGAVIGFLTYLGMGLIMYGATTVAGLSYYLGDAVACAVRFGAAGAVVGWLLGRGEAASAAD